MLVLIQISSLIGKRSYDEDDDEDECSDCHELESDLKKLKRNTEEASTSRRKYYLLTSEV